MDYSELRSANKVKGPGTGRVAVIKPSINSLNEMNIVSSIESHLSQSGKNLIVLTSKNDNVIAKKILIETAQDKAADIIITINVKPDEYSARACAEAGIPLIMIDGGEAVYVNCINIDDFQSGYNAAEYFIKNGRKRISIASGDPLHGYSQDMRLMGARKAFHDNNIPESKYDIRNYFLYSREDGIAAFNEINEFKPDAVFCANGDHFALGIIEEAMESGLKIPDDLAIIGHDDIGLSEAMGITTMRQPAGLMGAKAVEIGLDELLGKKKAPVSVIFQTEFIKRKTA